MISGPTDLHFRPALTAALRPFTGAPVATLGWLSATASAAGAVAALTSLVLALLSTVSEAASTLAPFVGVATVMAVIMIGIGASHAGLAWIGWSLERGIAPSFDACARAMGDRLPSIARASVNVGASCLGGLMCFYIGALVLAAGYACALPIVACEPEKTALQALDVGYRMANRHQWRVLALYLLASPVVLVGYVGGLVGSISAITAGASFAEDDAVSMAFRFASFGGLYASAFTLAVGAGFGAMAGGVYVVLRRQIDGASIEAIARTFE